MIAAVLYLVLGTLFLSLGVGRIASHFRPAYLEIRLSGSLPAQPASRFSRRSLTLKEALDAFRFARKNSRVREVLVRVEGLQAGPAVTYELRQEILELRERHKRVTVFLGRGSNSYQLPGNWDYFLASAADEIVLAPSSGLMVMGLRGEYLFLKELLDILGVEADLHHIGKYKTAGHRLTKTGMTEPQREMADDLLDHLDRLMRKAIAEGRQVGDEVVAQWIEEGPVSAQEAREKRMVDSVDYYEVLRKRYEKKPRRMRRLTPEHVPSGLLPGLRERLRPKVALVYANGSIGAEGNQSHPLLGRMIGPDALVPLFEKLAKTKAVRAIVLRVESPGGSAAGSDLIWEAVVQAAKKKPVVVSMGNVAGSGGYYIAMGASHLFATPATLTGSIGIIWGKGVAKELYEKIGVRKEILKRGRFSDLLTETRPFDPKEKEVVGKLMRSFYEEQFLAKAAQGRKTEVETIRQVAEGRVWTGEQASKIGLVDEIGTLNDAIAKAKELARIPARKEVAILEYPRRTLSEQLMEKFAPSFTTASLSPPPPLLPLQSLALLLGDEPLYLMPVIPQFK